MPNGQIFGGPRDGDWIASQTHILVLVESAGSKNQIVTYALDNAHKWIEVKRRDIK